MAASEPSHRSMSAWALNQHYSPSDLHAEDIARPRADGAALLLSEAVQHMAGGVALSRLGDGAILYANPALTQMLGYAPGELVGLPMSRLCPMGGQPSDQPRAEIVGSLAAVGFWAGDVELLRKDGSVCLCHKIISRYDHREHGELWLSIHLDAADAVRRAHVEEELRQANARLKTQMEELYTMQQQLHEQAMRDPLTLLFNRRYLHETLPREIARASRQGYSLAILMIDIDHFKRVNDTYGHDAGDAAIRAVAALLLSRLRLSDIACRYGGEEFLCVLLEATPTIAARRAEDLRAAVAELMVLPDYPADRVTISVGVSVSSARDPDMGSVIHAADRALYQAKADGRNCVRLTLID